MNLSMLIASSSILITSSSNVLAVVVVVVSSAYVLAEDHFSQSSMSETYNRKISGKITPPWGTPELRLAKAKDDKSLPIFTLWHLPVRTKRLQMLKTLFRGFLELNVWLGFLVIILNFDFLSFNFQH